MSNRKLTRKYYFSVDGETEQWYFRWLEEKINSDPGAECRTSLVCRRKDPLKNAKSLTVTQPTVITHVFDYESNNPVHVALFYTLRTGKIRRAQAQTKRPVGRFVCACAFGESQFIFCRYSSNN